jgi:hypothetical protein
MHVGTFGWPAGHSFKSRGGFLKQLPNVMLRCGFKCRLSPSERRLVRWDQSR